MAAAAATAALLLTWVGRLGHFGPRRRGLTCVFCRLLLRILICLCSGSAWLPQLLQLIGPQSRQEEEEEEEEEEEGGHSIAFCVQREKKK